MDRDEIKKTLKTLAMSQGSYGRLLHDLELAEQYDPGTADAFYEQYMPCVDAVDLIIALEQ